MSAIGAGSVYTTWKYGTGSSSASRSASHSRGGSALTLGAMPVAAAVVGDDGVGARPFSQRATWPPSAAVRQRSIAVITFIWSRLTWPALARRHAAPWSRKISATSSAGRDMAAGRYAGG